MRRLSGMSGHFATTVPADMRVLKALKQSSLALDLYAWAGLKVWQVNKKN